MRKGKLASWAVVALALMASAAPAPQITPLRELHVPFEQVRRILAGSPNAVLLPRAQYDQLRAAALTRSRGSHALQSAVLGSADCKVELRGRVAFFAATLGITVLADGVYAVPVRADGIDLLAVTIGGEAAPLWREGGRLHVLISGKGEHQVSVAGLLPVKTDSARQILSFSLPEATATRLHVVAPGDVEVKNETAVLHHAFIEKADHTELELVPDRGPMTVVLSRNHRQRQTDAIMDVRSVQFAAVHEDGETLRANVSLHIPHGSVGSLRLALPPRLAVTAVEGADVAQWSAADGVLQVSFRGDLTGRTRVDITGLRVGSPLGEWSFPALRPLDVMAHAAVLGVLLEDRLEPRDMVSKALMRIRPERLGDRVPGQLDASVRLIALHYAPQAEFGLSGRIVKPEATYRIGANHLLAVADTGLSLTSSFVISPEYERVFSVDVLLPAAWQAEEVRSGERAIPFECTVADGTNRVRVSLSKGARLGEDTPFTVVSRLVPEEWVGEWAQRAVPFPSVRVAGAREETGALAVVGADDFEVEAGEVRDLTALDQQERATYGLQSLAGGLAFRYEKPGYGLQAMVVRRRPRTTGETLSFFVVGEESLRCHYELSYAVAKARLQELEFSLPGWTPSALLVNGLRGTMVKEYSSVERDGDRHWTVRLSSPVAGVVRLGVDFRTVLAMGAEAELPMPVLAGVAYQTGRVAVEGEAGLDVRVTAHPRPVDIGELASPTYRLGPRLLGSFGFVGTPVPVRVSIARHDGYGLPPVLVEHMQMTSVFGASGQGQHAAQYRLRSKLGLLEVALPEGAELWSVLADGVPLTPLKGDGRLLFELPAEASGQSRSLLVVYETAVRRLGLRGRLEAFAPSLVLRGGGGAAMAVPAADLRWVVHLPANYRLSGTSGTVAATQPDLVMPAALRVGGLLYQSAGGASFERGILGGLFLSTLSRARSKAERSSDFAARGEVLLAEESAKADTAPAGGGMFGGDGEMGAGMGGATGQKRPGFDDDSIDDSSEGEEGGMGGDVRLPSLHTLKGSRSLEIALAGAEGGHVFRSLGAAPHLVVRVLDERRLRGICWAVAALVFAGGAYLTMRPRRRKAMYVAGVLVIAGLVPALPGLVGLALVLNWAFYAGVALVPYYVAAALVRRCWRLVDRLVLLEARTACLLLIGLFAAASARSQEGTRGLEIIKPEPVPLPSDAMVVPRSTDGKPMADVLIPLLHFEALRALTAPETEPEAAKPYGIGGAAYAATLGEGDRLVLKGSLAIAVYGKDAVFVPLDLGDAVVAGATLDDKPASLAFVPQVPRPAQQSARRPPVVGVVVAGKGVHVLALELRAPVTSEGGWQRVQARLPGSGASTVTVTVPQAGTEIVRSLADVPGSWVTKTRDESLAVPLAGAGALRLQWRPKTTEAVIDPTLTAHSAVDFLILEDHVRVGWNVRLSFRRGEREVFTFVVPTDYVVEQVTGDNVRGWQTSTAAGEQTITVTTLKPVAKSEQFAISLRQKGVGDKANSRRVSFPVLRATGAMRHTAELLVRNSPLLELRVVETDPSVRRQDVDEKQALGKPTGDSPFGVRSHAAYSLASLPCKLAFDISALPQRPTVVVRTILRLSRRERTVESRIDVGRLGRPLHGLRVVLPTGLTIEDVRTAVRSEWYVAEDTPERTLVVLLPDGADGDVALTLDARLPGALGEVPLPRIVVSGMPDQKGEIVVQSDPGLEVEPVSANGLERMMLRLTHAWLNKGQRSLARLAYRHGGGAFQGVVSVQKRPTEITAETITNIRVSDRTVEETSLLTFHVNGGGARELRFELPAAQAEAEISCPLLRRKVVQVVDQVARVQLELQDEVVGEIKVLVRMDRARSGSEAVAVPPLVTIGRTVRRILVAESAGRDEVVVDREASVGLEPLAQQSQHWGAVSRLLGAGASQAFLVRGAETAPRMALQIQRREAVETAGARIGLARTVLMFDNAGAFRGTQVFYVDNRTEQFLEIDVPEGAALWTARVGQELVKPVIMDATVPRRVSVPLVKTAAGDLDYTVTLKYGGTTRLPRIGGKITFPVVRPLNVTPERSQLELRLPRDRQWFQFDGTMGLVGSREQFQAGYLAYQNMQAKRLVQALQSSNAWAQKRATYNLRKLKGEMGRATPLDEPQGGLVVENRKQVEQTLALGEQQIAEHKKLPAGMDNGMAFQQDFARQKAKLAGKDTAVDYNWDVEAQKKPKPAPGKSAEPMAEVAWKWSQPQVTAGTDTPTSGAVVGALPAKKAAERRDWRQGQNRALIVQNAANAPAATATRGAPDKGRVFGAAAQADKSPEQIGRFFTTSTTVGARAYAPGLVDRLGMADASAQGFALTSAGTLQSASFTDVPDIPQAQGLASLDVDFPAADDARWETIRLATPRGAMVVTARGVGRSFQMAAQRLGLCLLAFAATALPFVLFVLLKRAARKGMRGLVRGLLFAGLVSLLFGIFPVVGLLLLVTALVLKLSTAMGLSATQQAPVG